MKPWEDLLEAYTGHPKIRAVLREIDELEKAVAVLKKDHDAAQQLIAKVNKDGDTIEKRYNELNALIGKDASARYITPAGLKTRTPASLSLPIHDAASSAGLVGYHLAKEDYAARQEMQSALTTSKKLKQLFLDIVKKGEYKP